MSDISLSNSYSTPPFSPTRSTYSTPQTSSSTKSPSSHSEKRYYSAPSTPIHSKRHNYHYHRHPSYKSSRSHHSIPTYALNKPAPPLPATAKFYRDATSQKSLQHLSNLMKFDEFAEFGFPVESQFKKLTENTREMTLKVTLTKPKNRIDEKVIYRMGIEWDFEQGIGFELEEMVDKYPRLLKGNVVKRVLSKIARKPSVGGTTLMITNKDVS